MTKEEIAQKYVPCRCDESYRIRKLKAPDCPYHSTDPEIAMDEWAKHISTAFLAWHTNKFNEYMEVLNSQYAIDGKLMGEIKRFETSDIEGRYHIFIEQQSQKK